MEMVVARLDARADVEADADLEFLVRLARVVLRLAIAAQDDLDSLERLWDRLDQLARDVRDVSGQIAALRRELS
jgi:hypothetical protein